MLEAAEAAEAAVGDDVAHVDIALGPHEVVRVDRNGRSPRQQRRT